MAKDSLARGARSANFGSMSHISQDKWDSMFQPESETQAQQTPSTVDISDADTNPKSNN
jgi:hypothetical protein